MEREMAYSNTTHIKVYLLHFLTWDAVNQSLSYLPSLLLGSDTKCASPSADKYIQQISVIHL